MIHDETAVIQENNFRPENSASLRRITPSTQVGRLSGSHSDIGLQLTQFPGGRKVREPQGERSKKLFLMSAELNGGERAAQLSCKTKVWGRKHEEP